MNYYNVIINGVAVKVCGEIGNDELEVYLDEYQSKRKDKMVRAVVSVSDGFVDIEGYSQRNVPFERLRRITGYLVGTTNRWNNAKKAELKDRVKHGVRVEDKP